MRPRPIRDRRGAFGARAGFATGLELLGFDFGFDFSFVARFGTGVGFGSGFGADRDFALGAGFGPDGMAARIP